MTNVNFLGFDVKTWQDLLQLLLFGDPVCDRLDKQAATLPLLVSVIKQTFNLCLCKSMPLPSLPLRTVLDPPGGYFDHS